MLKIKNSYNVIGVMSGTSIDGVDLCYSNFSYENKNWKFLIRIAKTVPYEKSWITKLTNAHALSEIELKISIHYFQTRNYKNKYRHRPVMCQT